MPGALEALKNENYLSLETFKKDGAGVKTPVWFAEADGKLVVFTDGTSFKVKRLGRNSKARVAACNASGKVHGTWFDATAEVLPQGDPGEKAAYAALTNKYPFQYRLLTVFSRLAGATKRRRIIVIRPA